MISLQVFPQIGAVRTRGPDGKIRTAGARVISQSESRFKIPDLGLATKIQTFGGIFRASRDFKKIIGFLEIWRDFLRFW